MRSDPKHSYMPPKVPRQPSWDPARLRQWPPKERLAEAPSPATEGVANPGEVAHTDKVPPAQSPVAAASPRTDASPSAPASPQADEPSPGPIFPFAIMTGVVLIIVGTVETLWLVNNLVGMWYLTQAEAAHLLPATWAVMLQAPAVLALPVGIWLLAAPGIGRVAATALLAAAMLSTLAAFDPVLDSQAQTAARLAVLGVAGAALWLERVSLGSQAHLRQP